MKCIGGMQLLRRPIHQFSREPFGTDTKRYDIPLDAKSLEGRSSQGGVEFLYLSFKRLLLFGMVLNGANGNTYTELQEAIMPRFITIQYGDSRQDEPLVCQ